jgi:hypothetical protein
LTSKNDLEPKSYIKKGLASTLASDIRTQIQRKSTKLNLKIE